MDMCYLMVAFAVLFLKSQYMQHRLAYYENNFYCSSPIFLYVLFLSTCLLQIVLKIQMFAYGFSSCTDLDSLILSSCFSSILCTLLVNVRVRVSQLINLLQMLPKGPAPNPHLSV